MLFLIFSPIKETCAEELEFSAVTDIDVEYFASPDNLDDTDWISTPHVNRNLAALNNFLNVVHGRDLSPINDMAASTTRYILLYASLIFPFAHVVRNVLHQSRKVLVD